MKPISDEKRADIIRLKQAKKKEKEISEFLDVSVGTVRKIWGIFVKTGNYKTVGYKGRTSTITPEMDTKIYDLIYKNPSITLCEIIEELTLNISVPGLSKRLKKQGMTFKKRRSIQKLRNEKMSL